MVTLKMAFKGVTPAHFADKQRINACMEHTQMQLKRHKSSIQSGDTAKTWEGMIDMATSKQHSRGQRGTHQARRDSKHRVSWMIRK